ncbi:MAG TPA: ribosome maturation factor RimM [Aggregatilineales bacterium]|nr:ribosome maturation factor RimM [Aggregatilineales bacterium]
MSEKQSASSENKTDAPKHLVIGQIIRPHGVRGELRVRVLTGYPERFNQLEYVVLGVDAEQESTSTYEVERARLHNDQAIVKIAGIDDREDADRLRNLFVMVSLEDAIPLEEGEYYQYQLIGLAMYTDKNEYLGDVLDILETGANDVYIVQSPRYGELLVPAIESVVQSIDLASQRIIITPIPGLLPDGS